MRRFRYLGGILAGVLGTAIVAACAARPAWAAYGFYVAGSVGESNVKYDASTFDAGSNDVGYEVAVGFQPLPVLAGEIDYDGLPRAFGGLSYADTYSVGAFALGIVPIPVVQLFGKLGIIDWRTDARSAVPLVPSFDRTGSNVAWGVGASTSWGRLGARLQFEEFDVAHASMMNLASIGLTWSL